MWFTSKLDAISRSFEIEDVICFRRICIIPSFDYSNYQKILSLSHTVDNSRRILCFSFLSFLGIICKKKNKMISVITMITSKHEIPTSNKTFLLALLLSFELLHHTIQSKLVHYLDKKVLT